MAMAGLTKVARGNDPYSLDSSHFEAGSGALQAARGGTCRAASVGLRDGVTRGAPALQRQLGGKTG